MTDIGIRRSRIKLFLEQNCHLDKKILVRKAKEANVYSYSEGDEDVYDSLKRFADNNNIQMFEAKNQPRPEQKFNEYIEKIDEDGELVLQKLHKHENLNSESINQPSKNHKSSFVDELIKEKENLESLLLMINNLLKVYNSNG